MNVNMPETIPIHSSHSVRTAVNFKLNILYRILLSEPYGVFFYINT